MHHLRQAPDPAPRILSVCRRMIRKKKPINFIGEPHIEWIQRFGGLMVLVPRTQYTIYQLNEYLPMHGLLLVESEDCHPDYFRPFGSSSSIFTANEGGSGDATVVIRAGEGGGCGLPSRETWEAICAVHAKDTTYDISKDRIEWRLLQYAMRHDVPVLGICRGSQLLNLAYGGTLYSDIETEVPDCVRHMSAADDENYGDTLRHTIRIEPSTPLHRMYGQLTEVEVNSYHHQAVRDLGQPLEAMARSSDGLIEAFYDPEQYDCGKGLFRVGLQYHPERLGEEAHSGAGLKVFQAFVEAASQRAKAEKEY